MGYSNIKRVLSAALLLAFSMPSTFAFPAYNSSYSNPRSNASSMTLAGDVSLTDNNQAITLSLRDSDVKQVLRMFADKAGMNIVFHSSVDGKVTLDLVNTPINEAFKLVLSVAGLNYYKQGNTMVIISKDSDANTAYSKQEMMVFPITYVSATSIADFLNQNVFSMKKTGMSGTDAATVNSATNELIVFGMPSDEAIVRKVIAQFDREPYSRTFHVNHTTPAEMADMICNLLLPSRGMGEANQSSPSKEGVPIDVPDAAPGMVVGGAAGIMTGGAAEAGGVDELKLGEGIVACTMAPTTSGSVAPFNVQNLSIAYFPQRGTITMMGGSDAQARMVEHFIKANDVKQPQAYLEVSIVELNEAGSKEFQNQWQLYNKYWKASFDGEGFSAGRPTIGNYTKNRTPLTRYVWENITGLPYQDKDGAWKVPEQVAQSFTDVLPGVKLSWTMNYIISNRKGRVLANPKILITNGKESVID